MELRAVGESWDLLRLLSLCKLGRAILVDCKKRDSGRGSEIHLQDMPSEVLDLIVDMVGYTPLPRKEEASREAWKERRRKRQ
jgi:hypothetical protein